MNNHIEKLLGQALDQTVPETWTTLSHEQITKLSQVFAELIVQECAQVAFEGDLKRAIGQWGSHSDILKHFEVEHDVVKTFRS